jgi:uncharacterized membrane protein YhhN
MKTKHQYLLLLFWVALLVDCYYIYQGNEAHRWITKGILMPLLLIYYLVNASRHHHLPSRIITVIAFVLAWAGDIFLLKTDEASFITGLVLFLLMHVAYLIYFARIHGLFPIKKPQNVWLPAFLVGIYAAGIMTILLADEGAQKLKLPLLAYMIVLSLMFVFACNVRGSKKAGSLSPEYFIPGAALFIISDSILGLNKFIWQEQIVGIAVILTYGYAQHLLVHGFIKHVKGRV